MTAMFMERNNTSIWKHKEILKNTESLLTDTVHLKKASVQPAVQKKEVQIRGQIDIQFSLKVKLLNVSYVNLI